MKCYLCHQNHETRPYGKDGQPICFDCMMGSEETQREAEKNFAQQLEGSAAHSSPVLLGKETGPEPIGGIRH